MRRTHTHRTFDASERPTPWQHGEDTDARRPCTGHVARRRYVDSQVRLSERVHVSESWVAAPAAARPRSGEGLYLHESEALAHARVDPRAKPDERVRRQPPRVKATAAAVTVAAGEPALGLPGVGVVKHLQCRSAASAPQAHRGREGEGSAQSDASSCVVRSTATPLWPRFGGAKRRLHGRVSIQTERRLLDRRSAHRDN